MRFKSLRPLALLILALSFTASAVAQSITAGDIAGTLIDPTGAAIANAQVTIVNAATGDTRTVTTTATGTYRFSLLSPGTYKVSAAAPGFSTATNSVLVAAGVVSSDNLKLSVGQGSTVVEVSTAPVLMNTENGDITTSFTSEQVQALPNPGNDLTFVAQTAPGSVMNTGTAAGGYGNFSSFGVSGLSNMFTLDGGYENDPFLNLNNTGASNLTLGNNEVDTVTVVSPAFSAQYGGLGGAQVNEITVAGSNRLHGQLQYYWSGRVLNSNDWFNKQSQAYNGEKNQASFVNANQWGASLGGPAIHDKLFWYVNTEGIRVTTPTSGQVYAPSPAFINCSLYGIGCAALNAAALANCEPGGVLNPNSTCVGDPTYGYATFAPAASSQVPLLTTIYNTYNNSPHRPAASAVHADPGDVSAVSYYAKAASFLSEWLLMARVDYKIGDKDNIYVHYKQDKGTQPTYVDLIDPSFTASSPQPSWEGQINETHTFTPNLTNQLVIAGNYYSAPFQNTNAGYLAKAPFTFAFIDGDLSNTNYGGEDYAFPQGRRVAGYQIIDDVTYNKGRNTLRFGYNFRRDNVTDLDQNRSVAGLAEGSVEQFGAGVEGYVQSQYFPLRSEQPVAVYNEGLYVQDEFKLTPTFTVIAGLRLERNSNPKCLTNCLQTLSSAVEALSTGTAARIIPYQNSAAYPTGYIKSGRLRAFNSYQKLAIMPRISFNFQPFGNGKTVFRGGFGLFSDSFPGLIADTLMGNVPDNFHAASYGPDAGYPTQFLDPSTAGSGGAYAAASALAFRQQYVIGGNYTTTTAAVAAATGGGRYSAPSFASPAPSIKYPMYDEWSLALEQKLDSRTTITVTYVGNHGYHEPVQNGGFNLSKSLTDPNTGIPYSAPNFFPTLATTRPNYSFSTVTNIYSGASSNFNGVVLSAQRRSKAVTLQFNYEYSHALDEVSNGGLEPYAPDNGDLESVANPTNLHAQYGNADYDVRQNVTGAVVWQVPAYAKLKTLTGGFEFSAELFHQTGLPYTVDNSSTSITAIDTTNTPHSSGLSNGTVHLYAKQLNNNFDHHCGGGNHALLPDGSAPNPCNFVNSFAAPTDFAQQHRNTLVGPAYTDVNFGAFKSFALPYVRNSKLKVGAQFYNFFNHANFQNPGHTLSASTSSEYGAISSTVSSPTNIFGSVGANSSPRLIQLKASLQF